MQVKNLADAEGWSLESYWTLKFSFGKKGCDINKRFTK